MKKIIGSLALVALLSFSCKKEEKKNVEVVKKGDYYPIGTVLKSEQSVNLEQLVRLDKTSWTHIPFSGPVPVENGWKPLIIGGYIKGDLIAQSPNDLYYLVLQTDGNLVLYKNTFPSSPRWATNESRSNNVIFQSNGNIVCIDINGIVVWSANKYGGPNPVWVVQDDGNLVGYSNHERIPGGQFFTITGTPFACTRTSLDNVSPCYGYMCNPW